MTFYNKLKWILGILMIFVLIIATNLIDKNNFVRVRDSVVTIYEDRLIANDLIFEMLQLVQEKEIAVAVSDSTFFKDKNLKVNTNLQSLVSRFEQTKLTTQETKVFDSFKNNLKTLIKSESQFLSTSHNNKSKVVAQLKKIKTNLSDLSKIQLNEGSRQMLISKRAVDTVELFTQIEIYFLVLLAIIIQIIVMYNPKEKA
ncbi:MAG: MCP four helix bundle domain-containing protein [Cellulophaga sp.]|uniref:MCP four helix bundle domain-containing protein n=1 Tax=unclassified Cellulophaga TaxID=2634405 RepID=UPI0026E2EBBB|nr:MULTISPECIES: MCP four helix bundle domain-containing protein [unclassified Cellulophaga]MDO6492408.1 MCP four helix bundle domain-containing protein [Cellulophaga sp. 2_MG-2023]MDO6496092.1 MCP four helix bundle domain-containing protein [Cellulophaga sp. 3_MG-2023]